MKQRLDQAMVARGLVATRSQAESYIRLGKVEVNGQAQKKPGYMVTETAEIALAVSEQYVSRAGMKLASVAELFKLDFSGKTVLDVGSSTGGFTDYSLRRGAKMVIAVDVGTNQLHPNLRDNERIVLFEQTDIRSVSFLSSQRPVGSGGVVVNATPDIVVIDVSFISLREILPHLADTLKGTPDIIAMVKPQFEASASSLKHKGVIKNDKMRRDILKDFESWAAQRFVIRNKADSTVAGEKGNIERFYHLRIAKR